MTNIAELMREAAAQLMYGYDIDEMESQTWMHIAKRLKQAAAELERAEPEPWHGHKFKEVRKGYWLCDCGKEVVEAPPASAVPAKDAFDLGFRFGRITTSEHYEGPPLRCPDGEHYIARRKEILDKAAPQPGGPDAVTQ